MKEILEALETENLDKLNLEIGRILTLEATYNTADERVREDNGKERIIKKGWWYKKREGPEIISLYLSSPKVRLKFYNYRLLEISYKGKGYRVIDEVCSMISSDGMPYKHYYVISIDDYRKQLFGLVD